MVRDYRRDGDLRVIYSEGNGMKLAEIPGNCLGVEGGVTTMSRRLRVAGRGWLRSI